jgi:predicted ester cyclase
MSKTDNALAYRSIIDAVSVGDLAPLERFIAVDLVDHNPAPGQPAGRAGFEYWARSARDAFPDLAGTVEDTVVNGDKVAARVTWRGCHRGSFVGLPGTGARVEFSAFHIVRFSSGMAVEWWGTADLLGALSQVGGTVVPAAVAEH